MPAEVRESIPPHHSIDNLSRQTNGPHNRFRATIPNMDTLTRIGTIRSSLTDRLNAPRQSDEGAPAAALEILPAYHEALEGLRPGDDIWLLTWLHHADRATLRVHPRSDPANPLTGVFATRSPDRPNPIGLHRVTITGITPPGILHIEHLEAIDGTPILDLKPILCAGR